LVLITLFNYRIIWFMNIPLCSRCKQPVDLETSKTDEYGQAIHEECCADTLKAQLPQTSDGHFKPDIQFEKFRG
jgi:hypothetical protein